MTLVLQSAPADTDRLARLALQAAELGTFEWDVVADYGRWSMPRLGWAQAGPWTGEVSGASELFFRIVEPADVGYVKEALARAEQEGGAFEAEFRVRVTPGQTAWFAAKGHVFSDVAGRAARMICVVRDATARHRDQEERERLIEAIEWEHERLRASELKHRELFEELRRQTAERQTIFDRVPAMIWYKDAENRVLRCNRAAAASLGMTVEQMEGRSTYDLFPDEAKKYHEDDLEVIRAGKPKLGIIEPLDQKGVKRWVQTDKIPHFDEAGRCVGVVVFAIDVTDRVRAEEILRESESAQRDFVANVSHEFRTPVAAIKGFAETLRRGALRDKENRARFVRIIERHAQRLGALIESLLTLSTIESGMVKLEPISVDLRAFVEEYVESIATLLRRKEIADVEVRISKSLRARADEAMLLQVLENLFGNAIKFNKAGGSISVAAKAIAGRKVQVTVRDTGCGIPPRDVPRVFDRFFKGSHGVGAWGSTGLGLHLVKKIVESHGGRVWVESRVGRGSAFHFTLPRA